ncbi:HD domain-containing protein [soil metagenome]
MYSEIIINLTKEFVIQIHQKDQSGHDWWHVNRVWKTARYIGAKENADMFIVELAALLHDVDDRKLKINDPNVIGVPRAKAWLIQQELANDMIARICTIIEKISFSSSLGNKEFLCLEAQIVQDADRLDALGAIGIARAFTYGGHKGRPIYDPDIKPLSSLDFDAYKTNVGTTINHFYEKLLLLKEKMNTSTGKQLALVRHQFVENFIKQFFLEWDSCYDGSAT